MSFRRTIILGLVAGAACVAPGFLSRAFAQPLLIPPPSAGPLLPRADDDTSGASRLDPPNEPAPALPENPLSPEDVARLVNQLASADYASRRKATQRLAQAGAEAIPALTEAAKADGPEVASRAIRILRTIYLDGDERAFEAAESALEKLTRSTGHFTSTRAADVLEMHYEVRERRAVAAVRKLGGFVKYSDRPYTANTNIAFVQLDQNWAGGDKGLKHIRRITFLPGLYVIEGAPVSTDAVNALHAEMPNLTVQRRGRAFLGVQAGTSFQGIGIQIGAVTDNSAASRAGIEPGDVITSFAGKPVDTFDALVGRIQSDAAPGKTVKVELLRGGRTMKLDVKMDAWAR